VLLLQNWFVKSLHKNLAAPICQHNKIDILYLVRSFVIFVNPLFKPFLCFPFSPFCCFLLNICFPFLIFYKQLMTCIILWYNLLHVFIKYLLLCMEIVVISHKTGQLKSFDNGAIQNSIIIKIKNISPASPVSLCLSSFSICLSKPYKMTQ
jgi:hypothetical protein